MPGPKEWSPKKNPPADLFAINRTFQRLHPRYRDWEFEFMMPGIFAYHREGGDLTVFFTPDFYDDGTVHIEIDEWTGGEPEEVETLGPFAFRRERTAERLFQIVKPVLDEHSMELPEPPSMGARRRGPKEWSPRGEPEEQHQRLVALAEELEKLHPTYRDWYFEYMYPGAFSYHRDGGDLSVFFTPDYEGKYGQVEIQLYNMEAGVDVGSAGPFGFRKDRSAERLFQIVKPTLDEYSLQAPPSMGAVPEDVRLQRPWEATFPLMDALGNIFGKKRAPEIHRKAVRRVGEEPVEQLGAGERGVAYLLPSGRVLKLTADADELRAAALLKGKDVPNVVRIHDAFYVREGDSGTGVIVRDAVDEPLGWSGRYPNLASLLRFSVVLANDVFIQRSGTYDDERRALRDAMGFLADEIRDPKTHRLDAHEKALVPGILTAMAALDKLGIYTIDLAPNNLGVTEGRPVVFDLSNASVPEDTVEAL